MTILWAETALLPDGFAAAVRLEIDAQGDLAAVVPGAAPPSAERLAGLVAAGHAEPAQPRLPARAWPGSPSACAPGEACVLDLARGDVPLPRADRRRTSCEAIAAQLYVEMLEAGYTAVGEFHYLHHEPRRAALRRPGRDVAGDPGGAAREPASA